MTDVFDTIFSRLQTSALSAVESVARQSKAAIEISLAEPYPPASQPGEPPHRRTGALHRGIQVDSGANGDRADAEISSSRVDGDENVPFWLELGTEKMAPRPFMVPERNRLIGSAARAVAAEMASTLGK